MNGQSRGPSWGRDIGPRVPQGPFPQDIVANGRELSVEELHRIARMAPEEVERRYVVPDVAEFIARVKGLILFWDGVAL